MRLMALALSHTPLLASRLRLLSVLLMLVYGVLLVCGPAHAFEFNYDEGEYGEEVQLEDEGPSKAVLESSSGVDLDKLNKEEAKQAESLESLKVEDVPENQRKYYWYDWRTSLRHCLTKREAFNKGYGLPARQARCDGGGGKKSY